MVPPVWVARAWLWLVKAWGWVKEHWYWLLAPVGIVLFLLGRAGGKKTTVVTSTELEKHDEVERQIAAQAEAKKEAINRSAQEALSGIEAAHSASVTSATQKTLNEAASAEGDSERVNDLLLNVGKDMRKP